MNVQIRLVEFGKFSLVDPDGPPFVAKRVVGWLVVRFGAVVPVGFGESVTLDVELAPAIESR